MIRPPPRSTLFPSTPLFRSQSDELLARREPPWDEAGAPLGRVPAPEVLDHRLRMDGRLRVRSEEHTSELQSLAYLVCRLLLEKKKKYKNDKMIHVHTAETLR